MFRYILLFWSDLNIVLIQEVKEGHQVNSLGEVLLLLHGEVGEEPEEGVLPLLLRFLTQPRKNSILVGKGVRQMLTKDDEGEGGSGKC